MSKKEIRERFRNECFKRDGFKCVECNETEYLEVHHITNRKEFKNGGYIKENGITLCPTHHLLAEHKMYTKRQLYQKINSTFEEAQKLDKLNI